MKFYYVISLYAFITYINLFSALNISHPEYKNYELFDIGFKYLPKIDPNIPDVILIIFYLYFTIKWFFRNRLLLSKFYLQLSLLFLMRLIAFNITYLPPINNDCIGIDSTKNGEILWITPHVGYACFDNMFSGHTVHMTLITLFTIYYSENWIEKWIVGVNYFPYLLMIVASRLHYSVDVWIGSLLSILLFYVDYIK